MDLLAATAQQQGNATLSTLLTDTNEYHTAPTDAARLANEAKVRELVFTHFSPPASNALVRHAFFRGVNAVRPAHWRAARDGLWIDIPVNDDDLTIGRLGR